MSNSYFRGGMLDNISTLIMIAEGWAVQVLPSMSVEVHIILESQFLKISTTMQCLRLRQNISPIIAKICTHKIYSHNNMHEVQRNRFS